MESIKQRPDSPLCLHVNDELRELKKIILTQMDGVIKQAEDLAVQESERVEGIRKALKEEAEALEDRLKEKEAVVQAKEAATKELEASFVAKIHALETRVEDLERLLEARDNELLESKSLLGLKDREIEGLKSELLEKKMVLTKFEISEWRSIGNKWRWKFWKNGSQER